MSQFESKSERLYPTPIGYSTKRPDVELPPIDRKALMTAAHFIASSRAALVFSHAMLN